MDESIRNREGWNAILSKYPDAFLYRAVADARQKAALLSQAAGVTLKEIQTIDYSWGEVRFRTETIQCSPAPCSREESTGSYDLDIEPDDICEEDSVTVVWEIA